MHGLPTNLNSVDAAAAVLIVLITLNGFRRGLSGELASTIGAMLSLLAGLQAYMPLGELVAEHTELSGRSAHALTFTVAVVAAFVAFLFVRLIVKRVITIVVNNRGADRLLGLFAGFLKAVVAVVIVFIGMNMWPHPFLNRVFGDESVIGSTLTKHLPEFTEQAGKIGEEVKREILETGK